MCGCRDFKLLWLLTSDLQSSICRRHYKPGQKFKDILLLFSFLNFVLNLVLLQYGGQKKAHIFVFTSASFKTSPLKCIIHGSAKL